MGGGVFGGERGIRTPDTVSRIPAFQASTFSHSVISPLKPDASPYHRAFLAVHVRLSCKRDSQVFVVGMPVSV